MRYESHRSEQGNVGVSYVSQEEADRLMSEMDKNNCINCINCIDCINCINCIDCNGCTGCRNCIDCIDCNDCNDCINCIDCNGCTGCRNCINCTDCINCRNCNGVLRWSGGDSSNLLAINGLIWPVAISNTHIQIGCQNHSITDWSEFSDETIAVMEKRALDFWKLYKELILTAAKLKQLPEID